MFLTKQFKLSSGAAQSPAAHPKAIGTISQAMYKWGGNELFCSDVIKLSVFCLLG